MTKQARPDAPSLGDLRKEIDRIDEAMHGLLMERGEIIDRLIAVKKTQESGSAFRPAREADMMRRLVQRHHGILPLDTAESIWRVIIATFTYVQAPFSVHADLSAGDAMMRDSARFHFGFTVPFVPHVGAAGVVEAVSESKGDLGLVPAFATSRRRRLVDRARIRQRAEDHRAAAVRRPPRPSRAAPGVRDLARRRRRHGDRGRDVERARRRLERRGRPRRVRRSPRSIAVPDSAFDGAALLVSVPAGGDLTTIKAALVKAGRHGALGGPRRQPRDPL